MKKTLFSLIAFVTVMVLGTSAYASTATTAINVSTTVVAAVSVSATDMNFGTTLELTLPSPATSTITVTASNGTPYAIALDAGQHFNGTWRCMSNGPSWISYGLYKIAGSLEWGDSDYANTYHWGSSVPGTGTGAAQTYTIYGQGIGFQEILIASTGNYSDVVTVTVNY